MNCKTALLSFDIEEFDLPTEHGHEIVIEHQLDISVVGLRRVLDLLRQHEVRATFYATVVFAESCPQLIRSMIDDGHEIASHGYCHGVQLAEHLSLSKARLEAITSTEILGFRSPRMGVADCQTLASAGYKYNSSMNPTLIPGRYNNLSKPRSLFYEHGIAQLPASVGYPFRFPLFWLSFNNLLPIIYRRIALSALNHDGYLNIYFHPWEFNEQIAEERFGVPFYIRRHSGAERIHRLSDFIARLKHAGVSFKTTSEFLKI